MSSSASENGRGRGHGRDDGLCDHANVNVCDRGHYGRENANENAKYDARGSCDHDLCGRANANERDYDWNGHGVGGRSVFHYVSNHRSP